MHSRVKGINEIQATRADLEKKENQTALNTSERKNDEVGIRVSTLRSNEICALFRFNAASLTTDLCILGTPFRVVARRRSHRSWHLKVPVRGYSFALPGQNSSRDAIQRGTTSCSFIWLLCSRDDAARVVAPTIQR